VARRSRGGGRVSPVLGTGEPRRRAVRPTDLCRTVPNCAEPSQIEPSTALPLGTSSCPVTPLTHPWVVALSTTHPGISPGCRPGACDTTTAYHEIRYWHFWGIGLRSDTLECAYTPARRGYSFDSDGAVPKTAAPASQGHRWNTPRREAPASPAGRPGCSRNTAQVARASAQHGSEPVHVSARWTGTIRRHWKGHTRPVSTSRAPTTHSHVLPVRQAHLQRRRNTIARDRLVIAAQDAFPHLAGADVHEVLEYVTNDLEQRAAQRRLDARRRAVGLPVADADDSR
jgi:hypothetical protein